MGERTGEPVGGWTVEQKASWLFGNHMDRRIDRREGGSAEMQTHEDVDK